MRDNDLDRILYAEEEIVPSSGFASSVMDAVHREASAPPPIPFPWKWAMPGLAACLLLLAFSFMGFGHSRQHASATLSWASTFGTLPRMVEGWSMYFGVAWIAAALVVSLVSLRFSMRIVAGLD